jgi:hypothetical protein
MVHPSKLTARFLAVILLAAALLAIPPTPYESGKSTLIGDEGSNLLVGGDPCDGDSFDGGPGSDTASFVRFNRGVTAEIDGAAMKAGGDCTPGSIDGSVEALEGSAGSDTLIGDDEANTISPGVATTLWTVAAVTIAWSAAPGAIRTPVDRLRRAQAVPIL